MTRLFSFSQIFGFCTQHKIFTGACLEFSAGTCQEGQKEFKVETVHICFAVCNNLTKMLLTRSLRLKTLLFFQVKDTNNQLQWTRHLFFACPGVIELSS